MRETPKVVIREKIRNVLQILTGQELKGTFLRALPFWLASIITGIVAVVYSKLFSLTEEVLQKILDWHAWLILLFSPFFFLLSWFLVKRFAPNAKGSGIPQVLVAIDMANIKGKSRVPTLLSANIIFVKIISSLCMVMGGGAIGREGPTIQVAGSIFQLIYKWVPLSWPKLSQKSFILTGAAAGLAAAFNTPLGGIVFAVEELAKVHFSFFRTALFTAVIIAGLTAQGFLGPYLYLGQPDVDNVSSIMYLSVVIISLMAGILSVLTCKSILRLRDWKTGLDMKETVVYIIASGLLISAIAHFLNDHILGSGKELMNVLLFGEDKHVSFWTMGLRMFGSILSFNVGGAGGVFAPALAAGATIGAYFSSLFDIVGANANILILSGMVGFLTGVTRSPFTSAILVLEMTDRHNVIFHLMLAAMLANFTAYLFDKRSLYEQLKQDYVVEDAKPIAEKPV